MDEENKERIHDHRDKREKFPSHHHSERPLKKKKKVFPTLNPVYAARNNHNNHDWKELSPPKLDFLSRIQSTRFIDISMPMERKSLRKKHKCMVHFGIGRGILVSFQKKKNEPVQMRYEMREFRVKFSCSNVQATYLISKQTTTDSFLRVSCSFLFHAFLRLINFFSSSSRSFSIVSIFGSSHLNAEFSKRIWKESV